MYLNLKRNEIRIESKGWKLKKETKFKNETKL